MTALSLLRRDLTLAFRIGGGGLLGVGFFLVSATLIPLGVGADPELLGRIAAGALWVSALLACLLSLDRLFQADFEDGSLDLILLAPHPPTLTAAAKTAAHWLTTGLPVTLAAPLLGVMLNMPSDGVWALTLTLLIGTPALSLIGAVGAALTIGVRRGGVLLTLLVLPLYLPTLIFGALAAQTAASGLSPQTYLVFLGAITLASAAVAPAVAAAAIRMNLT